MNGVAKFITETAFERLVDNISRYGESGEQYDMCFRKEYVLKEDVKQFESDKRGQ